MHSQLLLAPPQVEVSLGARLAPFASEAPPRTASSPTRASLSRHTRRLSLIWRICESSRHPQVVKSIMHLIMHTWSKSSIYSSTSGTYRVFFHGLVPPFNIHAGRGKSAGSARPFASETRSAHIKAHNHTHPQRAASWLLLLTHPPLYSAGRGKSGGSARPICI